MSYGSADNKKMDSMKKRKLCPNCKKPRIELYAGWITGSYHCKACGYIGPVVIEETRDKGMPMKKRLYSCKICGLKYRGKATSKKCEAWCRTHKSCNLEIAGKAVRE